MPTGLISEAIVSLTRCSTVRLARSGSRSSRLFGGWNGTEHIGLNQVVPTAGPADLDDVHRELLLGSCEADELVRGSRRAGQCAQLLPEHPRNMRELLFPADRTDDVTATSVELGGPEQVRVCVTDCGDTRPARVHLGEQRPSLKGVVHHLSLKSHENQSTCG